MHKDNSDFAAKAGIDIPLIQAPMAGANDSKMVIAVSSAGALGSLPCAMLTADQVSNEVECIRSATDKPFNLNFFCHRASEDNPSAQQHWQAALENYYKEEGVDIASVAAAPVRMPFDDDMCAVVESHRPAFVSFHFGLPQKSLVERVKAVGCKVISSATTVEEALWLERNGCDAIIAQGVEAGGHRGIFLTDDPANDACQQPGLLALLLQIVDAVDIPVIAAGGVGDGRGVAAARLLGASMVQMGTLFLFSRESMVSQLHATALRESHAGDTAVTNVFSGRPARGIVNRVMRELGPISSKAAPFPTAGAALAPLKKVAEAEGRADYSSLWAGQGVAEACQFASNLSDDPPSAEHLIQAIHKQYKAFA